MFIPLSTVCSRCNLECITYSHVDYISVFSNWCFAFYTHTQEGWGGVKEKATCIGGVEGVESCAAMQAGHVIFFQISLSS